MKTLRAALIALTLGLSLGLVAPSPANAAGERCVTNKVAKRCADIEGSPSNTIYANAGIDSIPSRARVRVVSVSVQHLSDGIWVTMSRNKPEPRWLSGGDNASTSYSCAGAASGKWRAKGVMEWKLGRDGKVRRGKVVSKALSRSRVCN